VLDSLRVVGDDARSAPVTAPKIKAMLALLLIRANHIVSTDQIIADLWGERPPRRAVETVYVYMSKLRKTLADAAEQSPIITRSPGYLIRVAAEELDLDVFLGLIRHSRACLWEETLAAATTALGLWHEPVLGDLRGIASVDRFSTWLEEVRLECLETIVEASLMLGRVRESVSLLYSLLQDYPLHETFYRQLMLALHENGRTGDALHVYQEARAALINDLGLEPSRALQEVQRHILRGGRAPKLRAPRHDQGERVPRQVGEAGVSGCAVELAAPQGLPPKLAALRGVPEGS
jgi:DNA-binding SARP family transcriptional activator